MYKGPVWDRWYQGAGFLACDSFKLQNEIKNTPNNMMNYKILVREKEINTLLML